MAFSSYILEFPRSLKAFLVTKLLAYTQSAFAQFLINIYFWRITQDVKVLVIFNIVFAVAHVIAFMVAATSSKKHTAVLSLQIGTLLQILYLLSVLFLQDSIVTYVILVAMLGGIAHGAYWFSDNLLKFDLTNPDNRLKFTGAYQSVKSAAGAIVPFVASLLVLSGGDVFHSYARVFIAAIICTLLVLAVSVLTLQTSTTADTNFAFVTHSKKLWHSKNIRLACISTLLGQIAVIIPTVLGLLLFIRNGSELSLGSYQLITVCVVIVTNYYMGTYFHREHYRKLLMYGGILNFLFIVILLISQSYLAILLYGVLTSLCSFMLAPQYPMIQDALTMYCSSKEECQEIRVEYIALQECFDGTGKVIGFLILLLIGNFTNIVSISSVLILAGLSALASTIVITRIKDPNLQTLM